MLRNVIGRALAVASLGAFAWSAPVQAALLDFENVSPASFLYGDGETFMQSGFSFTSQGDFGTVGDAASFVVAQAPSGNATSFYSALNDSRLLLDRTDGATFDIFSFDAVFVAPAPLGADVAPGRIVLLGSRSGAQPLFQSWDLAASDASGHFAFSRYTTDFDGFRDLTSASFFACTFVGDGCVGSSMNLAQFSLDNIRTDNLPAVPEPSTYALFAVGLAGVMALARRHGRR